MDKSYEVMEIHLKFVVELMHIPIKVRWPICRTLNVNVKYFYIYIYIYISDCCVCVCTFEYSGNLLTGGVCVYILQTLVVVCHAVLVTHVMPPAI